MNKNKRSRKDSIKTTPSTSDVKANCSSIEETFDLTSKESADAELIFDYSLDLIRSDDLLFLKFYFINVDVVDDTTIHKKKGFEKAFALIKIPPQHVSEELETKIHNVTERDDFERKKSFLTKHSWLAFELKKNELLLDEQQLLNWNENFKLITIDSFNDSFVDSKQNIPYRKNYGTALDQFKKKFGDHKFKLTSIELPYKMFLSPIAGAFDPSDNLKRWKGSFIFKDRSYQFRNWNTVLRTPWAYQLLFRNIEGEETSPSFKVVSYDTPNEKDECAEFLPAPIHRRELHHLTMRPEIDRDVLSNYFKVSALGGSTYLKYRNDNPLDFSTVAWEQDVKLARDNYVSITFRAVDIFTGIKLLVSIVSERRYKFGVSFLEKRYFVTYAENEKIYDQDVVISSVPFRKIIPKSPGTYFEPLNHFPETGKNKSLFLVTKPDTRAFAAKNVTPFEYSGIDKDGKEHQFKLKMAFVPAETYILTKGKYQWDPTDPNAIITAGEIIPFTQIGLLDPTKDEDYKGPQESEIVDCQGSEQDYKYRLVKNFDVPDERKRITKSLEHFKKHVLNNASCYQANIESKMTFAKLDQLKQASIIDENSSAATFNTKAFLLFSEIGDEDANLPKYDQSFPLRVLMLEADIRISQIDQMERISSFRKVSYYDNYVNSRKEIDEFDQTNQKKLLFQLVSRKTTNDGYKLAKLSGFFTQNYKSAGALVNPGITISHISILDQGITYNDLHNKELETKDLDKKSTSNKLPSISVFGSLDAEIMGMPIKDLIGDMLPVKDIPVFNYLEKSQDSLKKLGASYDYLKETIKGYEAKYEESKAIVREKELIVKQHTSNNAKHWLDSIIDQFDALEYYKTHHQSLYDLRVEIKAYIQKTLLPISEKIYEKYSHIKRRDIEKFIDGILRETYVTDSNQQQIFDNIYRLIREVYRNQGVYVVPKDFKELVKIYCISETIQSYRGIDFSDKIIALNKLIEDEIQPRAFFKELQDAFKEANLWSQQYLKKEEEKLDKQVNEALQELKENIMKGGQHAANPIIQQLTLLLLFRKNEAQDIDNIRDTIAAVNKLTRTYENYFKVYQTFGEQHYTELCNELQIPVSTRTFENIEKELLDQFERSIRYQDINISVYPHPQVYTDLSDAYQALKDRINDAISKGNIKIKDYITQNEDFNDEYLAIRTQYAGALRKIDEEYHDAKEALEEAKSKVKVLEANINSFANDQLSLINKEIEKKKQELIRLGETNPNYQATLNLFQELKTIKDKIGEASHQKFNYKHTTKNFKKASLGGVIEFIPRDTELNIDVNSEIQLDIDQLDRPPSIAKQDYYTKTVFTNFNLSLLRLLNVEFDRVSFITGSTIKDNFSVEIRNVEFGGPLSFTKAFQEYLSNVSDNLVFEITSSFAKVGYGFSIPDFTAGYFNFFNLNLSAQMRLPFDPKKSLQLAFGFGSEQSKFGITVAGMFGGQGYFNIIAEPKRGIVGMVLVMEFGAIFYLDLFVAKGTAYLVGGIFIKKYLGEYELRGYILCVGRFNVLGIFSASVTFYLGLEGNSDVLYGQCVVTVTKRFSRFFKLSVKCRMKKRIKGGDKQSNQSQIANDDTTTNICSNKKFSMTGEAFEASKTYFASYIA